MCVCQHRNDVDALVQANAEALTTLNAQNNAPTAFVVPGASPTRNTPAAQPADVSCNVTHMMWQDVNLSHECGAVCSTASAAATYAST